MANGVRCATTCGHSAKQTWSACSWGYVGADNVFYDGNEFGEGVGDILLNMVQCEGTEQDLLDCPQGATAGPPCDHSEDVGG